MGRQDGSKLGELKLTDGYPFEALDPAKMAELCPAKIEMLKGRPSNIESLHRGVDEGNTNCFRSGQVELINNAITKFNVE